jgi:hypothetical protein
MGQRLVAMRAREEFYRGAAAVDEIARLRRREVGP